MRTTVQKGLTAVWMSHKLETLSTGPVRTQYLVLDSDSLTSRLDLIARLIHCNLYDVVLPYAGQ